jgi:hypothetical protein
VKHYLSQLGPVVRLVVVVVLVELVVVVVLVVLLLFNQYLILFSL